jgi:hypothetical protein
LDAAANFNEGDAKPGPGAVSLCFYCGAICVFDSDMMLQSPTEELLDKLRKDKEFLGTFASFSWVRQYVLLKSHFHDVPQKEENH